MNLLEQLKNYTEVVAGTDDFHSRWMLNENAMAMEKLSELIRVFNAAPDKLKKIMLEFL